ncbi:MAG: glycerate kinase [Prevotella sp.]|nr:glycerate kinase [Prevotella sp.]
MKQKIIIAIDSFKGCMTSQEANQAAAEGVIARMPDAKVIQIPVSDGGEGWLTAFQSAMGGEMVTITVRDPLLRPITANYLIHSDTAVIEIAQASGLTLLSPEERNPLIATSYGTGQLIVDAVRRGCRNIIVGLGGSATSDCGMGMLHAIIDSFAKQTSIAHSRWDAIHELDDIRFTIATDVTNPLCGDQGAAHVFAPQKGATPEMVRRLDNRAKLFAEMSARHFGYDRQDLSGAGAAGGLGYAFLQYMNATCRSGIDLLLEAVHFDELLEDTTLVITGEGAADRQTLMGKLPYGILQHAKAHQVPVCLIAGRITDQDVLLQADFAQVSCINPTNLSLSEAMRPEVAQKNISATVTSTLHR